MGLANVAGPLASHAAIKYTDGSHFAGSLKQNEWSVQVRLRLNRAPKIARRF